MLRGVLSSDHVHMFVSMPLKLPVSDLVREMKGRSSHKVQREFPAIRKRYWGCRFWGRKYFSPPTVPSPKTLYFSTWKVISPNLPAPVGSRSVRLPFIYLRTNLDRK